MATKRGKAKAPAKSPDELHAEALKGLSGLKSSNAYFDRAYRLKMKLEKTDWDTNDISHTLIWLKLQPGVDMSPFNHAFATHSKDLPDALFSLPDAPRTLKNRYEKDAVPPVTESESASASGDLPEGAGPARLIEGEYSGSAAYIEPPRKPTMPQTPHGRKRKSNDGTPGSRKRPTVSPFTEAGGPSSGSPTSRASDTSTAIKPGPGQSTYPYPWWPDKEEDLDAGNFDPFHDWTNPRMRKGGPTREDMLLRDPLLYRFEDDSDRSGGWRGIKSLGEGGFGIVALWVRVDGDLNILERMAVKEAFEANRHYWRSPREWRDKLPRETAFCRRLEATGNSEHFVRYKGHRIIMRQQRHRLYLEFCDYGDLHSLCDRFPLKDGRAANALGVVERGERKTRARKAKSAEPVSVITELPEAWIWYCFYALVDACIVMKNGSRGAKRVGWREIMHCDLKPRNVLIIPPRPEEVASGSAKGKGKAKADAGDDAVGSIELLKQPNWPTPVVTDFGVAFDDGPDNPREYFGEGTPHLRPPEHRADYYKKEYQTHRMDSKANVWGVGAIIWYMISNVHFEGPINERGGLPSLDEVDRTKINWLDIDVDRGPLLGRQTDLKEEDYERAEIFGPNSWPLVGRYSEKLKDLVRQCLRFRAQDRPTLEKLRNEIVPELDLNAEPPDLWWGDQPYREGARLASQTSGPKKKM